MSKGVKMDTHHLCFTRRKWSKGYVKAIRNYWYFIVLVPKDTLHATIHHYIKEIPTPHECSAKIVYDTVRELDRKGILKLDDDIEDRLILLIDLFSRIEPSVSDAFRVQLEIIRNNKKAPR